MQPVAAELLEDVEEWAKAESPRGAQASTAAVLPPSGESKLMMHCLTQQKEVQRRVWRLNQKLATLGMAGFFLAIIEVGQVVGSG